MARITGTAGSDLLRGLDEYDRILGLDGDDDLDGGAGDDMLYGGAGNDVLVSRSGYDRLDGGDGDDRIVLVGTGGAVTGGAGFDSLVVNLSGETEGVRFNGASGHAMIGNGQDLTDHIYFRDIERLELQTGSGNDYIRGTTFGDIVLSGAGDDDLDGGAGDDKLYGGAGNDILTNSSGYDRLDGGEGDDRIVLVGTGGAVTGGAGFDRLSVDLSVMDEAVRFNGVNGHAVIGSGAELADHIYFSDVERLELKTGSGNDHVLGTAGDDTISTGAGADVIGPGWTLDRGASALGDDVIDGGAGDDLISDAIGANRLHGGAGDDVVITSFDTLEATGGDGDDRLLLHYRGEPQEIILDFERGTASTGLSFSGFEHAVVSLGSGDDVVFGSSTMAVSVLAGEGDNLLFGSSNRDDFQTGSGDDIMFGNGGDDALVSVGGADVIDGGEGDDLILLYRPEGIVEGGAGNDVLEIAANELDRPIEFDALTGTMGSSLVFSGIENVRVVTNQYYDYDDTLRGGAGNDFLTSNKGEDVLDGRGGDDQLWGGGGADRLTGGAGADTFIWGADASAGNGIDRVTDFDTESGDVLRFTWNAQRAMDVHDFDGFLALASDRQNGVFISFGQGSGDGILLEGVARSELSANDVDFFL